MISHAPRSTKPFFLTGKWSLGALFTWAAALFCAGCNSGPPLTEYPTFIDLPGATNMGAIPLILVGRIVGFSTVGHAHSSRWESDFPVQLARVNVQVETVLQSYTVVNGILRPANEPAGVVSIFYYFHPEAAVPGVAEMGMSGHGGSWHIGDRVMFFLQRENGYLRTLCDRWRHCTRAVLTGSHLGYRPRSNDVTVSIIDILLTRGQGASDQQIAEAIQAFRPSDFNPTYAVQKLQELAQEETPVVREVARQKIEEELTYNCQRPPTYVTGPWEVPCLDYRKTHPYPPPGADDKNVLPGILRALPPPK